MKKFLCAVIVIVLVMSLCSVVNAASKDENAKLQVQVDHENKQNGGYANTPQQNGRKWQYGLDKWRKGAKYQITNWSFSPDKVTAELIDRKGNFVKTLEPVKLADGGFQLPSGGIPQGTQLIVPEGCLFCGNEAYVGKSQKSGTADFEGGEHVYYFSTDPKYGFTIYPYHKPLSSQSYTMPDYEE